MSANLPVVRIVAVMMAVQVFNGVTGNAASVYGPVVTAALGVPAQTVGIYLGTMFATGLVTGFFFVGAVRRYGAVRMMQVVVLLSAIGLSLPALGSIAATLAGAVVIGFASGLSLPASSHILASVTPKERLGLIFSLKQTGVPIGIALNGVVIPALLLNMSWQMSLLPLTLVGLAALLLLQPMRGMIDGDRDPDAPLRGTSILAPLRFVWREKPLRTAGLIGLVLCAGQLAMLGYLVTYLNLELGHTLVAAGLVLTISQVSTVFARVAWGVLADRLGDPLRVLGIVAAGSGLLGFVVAAFQPDWTIVAVGAVLVPYSLFTMGWNGVHLATVTRYARGDIPSAMIGTQLFSFIGMLGGPLLFAGIVSVAGRYWVGFAVFAAASLAAGVALLRLAPKIAGR